MAFEQIDGNQKQADEIMDKINQSLDSSDDIKVDIKKEAIEAMEFKKGESLVDKLKALAAQEDFGEEHLGEKENPAMEESIVDKLLKLGQKSSATEAEYSESEVNAERPKTGIYGDVTQNQAAAENIGEDNPYYYTGLVFLEDNPGAFGYICSAEMNGKEMPVNKGFMTSNEYYDYIKKLGEVVDLGMVRTVYGDKLDLYKSTLRNSEIAAEGIEDKEPIIDDLEEFDYRVIDAYEKLSSQLNRVPGINEILDYMSKNYDEYWNLDTPEMYVSYANAVSDTLKENGLEEVSYVESSTEELSLQSNSSMLNSIATYLSKYLSNKFHRVINALTGLKSGKIVLGTFTPNEQNQVKSLVQKALSDRGLTSSDLELKQNALVLDNLMAGATSSVATEDTVRQGNHWVNKGKEGTHGKFKTKKAADAQRKAMFARGYQANEEIGDEEMYGFEAMSTPDLEAFQAVIADQLNREGSISTLEKLMDRDLTYDFTEQINFIKNTSNLSNTNEVLNEILKAAETLLDDMQIETLVEELSKDELEEPEEMVDQEFEEYQEPEDWSKVDETEEVVEEEPTGEETV